MNSICTPGQHWITLITKVGNVLIPYGECVTDTGIPWLVLLEIISVGLLGATLITLAVISLIRFIIARHSQ
jgi:hypothetical protein